MCSTPRLDTLKEEDSYLGLQGKGVVDREMSPSAELFRGNRAVSPYCNGSTANTKSRNGSISSNSVSTNSKTVGLGLARRPSDNLLLNMTALDDTGKLNDDSVPLNAGCGLPPPRKNFVTRSEKSDRPISNDSIATRTTELFSSNSSDVNSRSSSLENDNRNDNASKSDSGTDDDSVLEISSQKNSSAHSYGDETIRSAKDSRKDGSAATAQRTRYFFNNGSKAQSQISFAGTTSTLNSPAKTLDNTTLQQPSLPTASPLYQHSNSTSAILTNKARLTPSQRYRLRKAQNETVLRKSIRRKEKFYDEQEKNSDLPNDFENLSIWNIPMASASTSTFLNSSQLSLSKTETHRSHGKRSNHNVSSTNELSFLDSCEMPTSPIPGVNRTTDFQYMQQTSKNLTSVYKHSSSRLSESKLSERTASADFLPIEFKTASDLGLEDLKLVSEDKLGITSHSRPSWLPPKDPEERKLHDAQISKSTSMASIEQLDRSKEREERLIKNETNRQKYVLLLDRDITRNSSLQDLKKLIWETPLTDETRYQVYDEILQSNIRLVTGKYVEQFDDLFKLLNEMDFPRNKEAEIEELINMGIRRKAAGKEKISKDLPLMLKLKSISRQGLIPGDELLFHHFLLSQSFTSLKQVWEVVNLIQMTCFNDLCKEKFNQRVLNSRGVVAHYLLRGDDFKKEFNATCLNATTWWNVLERIDHSLFMWVIDIIVVSNNQCFKKYPVNKEAFAEKHWEQYRAKHVVVNYKILASLVLDVLLNYHFGFDDLKSLSSLNDSNFCIPMPMDYIIDTETVNSMFIRKWLHYYKKF